MGTIRTGRSILLILGLPCLCVVVLGALLFIAGVFESAVIEPIQKSMPQATQTAVALSAAAELAPTGVPDFTSGARADAGAQEPTENVDDTQMFIAGLLFVLIVVVVVFAGPLQKMARP